MSLAIFDVKQQLANDLKNVILTSSYQNLHTYLVEKQPIPGIYQTISSTILALGTQDKVQAKTLIEQNAFNEQCTEDTQQLTKLNDKDVADRSKERRLQQDLQMVNTRLNNELNDWNRFSSRYPQYNQYNPTNTHFHTHMDPYLNPAPPLMDPFYNQRMTEHGQQVDAYNSQIRNINSELITIGKDFDSREAARQEINNRQSAKDAFTNKRSGATVSRALNANRNSALNESIRQVNKQFDDLVAQKTQEAVSQNYPIFLEQMEVNLRQSKLVGSETDALRHTLKLMKDHVKQESLVNNTFQQLNSAKQTLQNNKARLADYVTRKNSLIASDPELKEDIVRLKAEIDATTLSNAATTETRASLYVPAMSVTGAGLFFSLPFILGLSGVIPNLITSTGLFLLVTVPPAITLAVALCIGISLLVFTIQIALGESSIQDNYSAISDKEANIDENAKTVSILGANTIPQLEATIASNNTNINQLEVTLERQRSVSAQILAQAKNITPVSYASSIFASGSVVRAEPAPPNVPYPYVDTSSTKDDALAPPRYN